MAKVSSPLAGGIVGALVVVEFTSGVIQGYYTPLFTDIARFLSIQDADINWFEAAQLLLSAMVVPVLARLGDMYGHRRVLIGSLAVTALASWGIAVAPSFPLFVIVWAIQGFYVVWLPLNVSIIHARARSRPDGPALTRKGAGIIVMALEAGAITGALAGGQLGSVWEGRLWLTLSVPAAMVTLALLVVIFMVPDPGVRAGGRIDWWGTTVLSLALLAITGGLSIVRLEGVTWGVFALIGAGLVLAALFVWIEQRSPDPLVDMKLLKRPTVWPVVLMSALFGVSVLGAQGPLSTFVRTDPAEVGYGLGLTPATASYIIGAYVFSLLIGAGLFSRVSLVVAPRTVLVGASLMVAAGYSALVPFHGSMLAVIVCMVVAGLGSGALVAALPAAAAAAAPPHQTGVATGLTNVTKTVGGSFASSAFAIALAAGVVVTVGGGESTAGSLAGYYTVWLICGVTALVAALVLLTVPRVAFTSNAPELVGAAITGAPGEGGAAQAVAGDDQAPGIAPEK